MKKARLIYTIYAIIALFIVALPAMTASGAFSDMQNGLEVFNQHAGLPQAGLNQLVGSIIKQALSLLGIFTLIIVMYGGFLWMISGANEDKKKEAKGVFVNGLIGLAIILMAYSAVNYIFDVFQSATMSIE
ncbi:MAG TPA: hypothetical protein VMX18_01530 [Candidatus Bipolaricaulota bacterium]|nr:hypothetical protein [Candidatus Bipolaricaulota bacterium]